MRFVTSLPRAVRSIENVWIPLSDGTKLAARIWLPEDAEADPVPAILEYIPYRKRDYTRGRDQGMHPYFAGHGYAAIRVDMRGSGESEGLLLGEYLKQEQDDAVEAIAWIAAQPWCTGKVGMMGKSWGGFNALQVAARRPPALAAIITVMSTDDRYADDIHFMGGALLTDNLEWGTVMLAFSARPPDPAIVGERWRAMWLDRLANDPFLPAIWLRHQLRDDFWRHGSVCEDWSAIECPVFVVSGWADGYSDPVFRMLEHLRVPRLGLVGPWSHIYPQDGVPGPAIGFLQEAVRWWDHWLKGKDTGIMAEPMLRAWIQDPVAPATYYAERPGRWVGEASWPSPSLLTRRFVLNHDGLGERAGGERPLVARTPQTVGLAGGDFSGFGVPGDLPGDQREDDGNSLTFDSEPLAAPFDVLGPAVLELELAVDRPLAFVAARLTDVAPGGAATRVSYGVLNLARREGPDRTVPMVPGERTRVRLQLHDAGHRFAAGHRVRVAIATSYWPLVWPSPEPVTLTLFAGASSLRLPARSPAGGQPAVHPFAPPESAPPLARTVLRKGAFARRVERDLATGEVVMHQVNDGGLFGGEALSRIDEIDLTLGHRFERWLRIHPDDPLCASHETWHTYVMERGDWRTRVAIRVRMWADRAAFHLAAELDAFEGEARVFSREWSESIPRDGV
jgi:hypothetical protein